MLEGRDHQRLRRGDQGRRTRWDAETDATDDPAEVEALAQHRDHALPADVAARRPASQRQQEQGERRRGHDVPPGQQRRRRCAAGPELGADEAGAPGGDQGKSEKDPHASDVTIPVGILAVESKEESHEHPADIGLTSGSTTCRP